MPSVLFEKGREGFLDGTIDWDTNTIKLALIDPAATDTGIKTITGATNATPIVVTATSHGFTNGDLVSIANVAGNLATNGVWKIANVAANTFELTDPNTSTNAVGSGTYSGSGGYAVNLGTSASGDNWDDFDACVVGTPQALTSPTVVAGVAKSASPVTNTAVSAGNTVRANILYKDTGTASTSRVIRWFDGNQVVTAAATAASSATTIVVDKLTSGIPNGTVIAFSNGQTATLSALASAGDRALTVTALGGSVTAGSRGSAPRTGSGLPVITNGGNITTTMDSTNGWFKL